MREKKTNTSDPNDPNFIQMQHLDLRNKMRKKDSKFIVEYTEKTRKKRKLNINRVLEMMMRR